MKFLSLITSSLIAIFLFLGSEAQAQSIFNDTILVFNQKADFLSEQEYLPLLGETFLLPNATLKAFRPISVSIAKKVHVPRATKVSAKPIILKHKGNCYKFGCQKGGDCESCKLVWYDRNGDGKVQPKRELRCICTDGGKCRVRVERVKCK